MWQLQDRGPLAHQKGGFTEAGEAVVVAQNWNHVRDEPLVERLEQLD
jgi:hypothetical protein